LLYAADNIGEPVMHHKPFAYATPRKPRAGLLRAAVIVLALSLGAPFAAKACGDTGSQHPIQFIR
jgi:hypothetical protein